MVYAGPVLELAFHDNRRYAGVCVFTPDSGVLLMIFKMQTLNWAMTIAGAFFLLVGLLDLLGKRIYSAIVNFAIGAIILIIGWTILEIVLIVFGILVAARGLMDLIEIIKSKTIKQAIDNALFAGKEKNS